MLNSPLVTFSKAWIQGNSAKTTFSKLKATIIALTIGCLVGIIVISGLGKNGFSAFGNIFADAFQFIKLGDTLVISTILIVVGIANAVAFKAGLFNIGVTGQMLFASALTMMLGTQLLRNTGLGGVVLLVLVSMVAGALVAAFAGALKAFFNVHEVVTTIILNWALFFLMRWIMLKVPGFILNGGQNGSVSLSEDMQFLYRVKDGKTIVLIVFGVVFALVIAFIFWKTTFGFKLKATGLNADAAEYAGINRRRRIMFAMALSGVAAGLGGALVYVIQLNQIPSSLFSTESLPTWGFDGIAIALLAFNNPLGIVPIGLFFGALRNGASSLSRLGIDRQVYDLVVGVIMYLAAISSLFIRFKLGQLVYVIGRFAFSSERRSIRAKYMRDKKTLPASRVAENKDSLHHVLVAEGKMRLGKLRIKYLRGKNDAALLANTLGPWALYLERRQSRPKNLIKAHYRQAKRRQFLIYTEDYAFYTSSYARLLTHPEHQSLVQAYKVSERKSKDRQAYQTALKALMAKMKKGER